MAKGKSMKQKMQSMAAEANNAAENTAFTSPTYHKDKHEPNRPSI
ncbi:hypothetical protein PAESOLCIP111_04506 [Paenibacillus solanacearum]|uniref:Uncharacterized protein n=1 Tax=Paenibacillus solanacearum TaxID=2048548 RepID=A0A916K894_9BACL|nr:hypothetical protein [Paenibacillus solanacearum]CAG7643597.1 hypothetical protein PAESOLCIP111_04506 [Paenibacillus solanacearum]